MRVPGMMTPKAKYISSSDDLYFTLHREWHQSRTKHRVGIDTTREWANQRSEVHGRRSLACSMGFLWYASTVSQWAHVLTPPQGQEVFSAYSTTTYRLA